MQNQSLILIQWTIRNHLSTSQRVTNEIQSGASDLFVIPTHWALLSLPKSLSRLRMSSFSTWNPKIKGAFRIIMVKFRWNLTEQKSFFTSAFRTSPLKLCLYKMQSPKLCIVTRTRFGFEESAVHTRDQ